MPRNLEKITPDMKRSGLSEDLEKYRAKAIELGASRAAVLRAADIPVEEGVVVKCRIPRCFGYGTSVHCPPHVPKPAEMKAYLEGYDRTVFFTREVPTELLLRERADKERRGAFRSIYDIVSRIESMAFYDGHPLAFGLGAGSCRMTFCAAHPKCQALEGEPCRFPLMARPSMESVGINVYRMTAAAGWDIYPIGTSTDKDDAPQATLAGIVIIQ